MAYRDVTKIQTCYLLDLGTYCKFMCGKALEAPREQQQSLGYYATIHSPGVSTFWHSKE
jgi:hypothetical protein